MFLRRKEERKKSVTFYDEASLRDLRYYVLERKEGGGITPLHLAL